MEAKELMYTLMAFMDADAVVRKAQDEYEERSFDYHHRRELDERERCEKQFTKALDEYVDFRIKAALAKRDEAAKLPNRINL